MWGRTCLGYWLIAEMVQTQIDGKERLVMCRTSVAALLTVKAHRYIQHKYEALRAQNDKDSFHITTMEQSHDCLHCNFSLGLLCQAGPLHWKEEREGCISVSTDLFIIHVSVFAFFPRPLSSFESFLFYTLLPSLNMCNCSQLCRLRVSNIGSVI